MFVEFNKDDFVEYLNLLIEEFLLWKLANEFNKRNSNIFKYITGRQWKSARIRLDCFLTQNKKYQMTMLDI